MTETTVISNNEPEGEGVLAEAAVAAAAVSGAAAAGAAAAQADAEEAEAKADAALAQASHATEAAHHAAMSAPSHDEVREIAKSEAELILARLAEMIAAKDQTTTEVDVEEVPEEVKPTSVEKAAKPEKKSFRQRYLGLD